MDYFKKQNLRVKAIKPIASGCVLQDGVRISQDEQCLQRANGNVHESLGSWRFMLPIAPHIAAEQEGVCISINALINDCHRFHDLDVLLIEGAGGLMVPLNPQETWLDFLVHMPLSVIVVVGMQLGCINHALLTTHTLNAQNIHVAGWIANELDPNMLVLEENIQTLKHLIHAPLLARVGFKGDLNVMENVW